MYIIRRLVEKAVIVLCCTCTYKISLDNDAPFGEKFSVDFAKLYVSSERPIERISYSNRERRFAELQARNHVMIIDPSKGGKVIKLTSRRGASLWCSEPTYLPPRLAVGGGIEQARIVEEGQE